MENLETNHDQKKERNEDEMEKKLKKVIRKRYNSDKSAKMV